MKKLTLTGLVAAGVLLTTACSEDNTFQPQPGEGGNVTFTIQLPAEGLGSRAFADGLTADDLEYAVYDAEGNLILRDNGTASFAKDQLTTTVSLSLANGKSYSIAFFAHKKAQKVYTFNAATKTITVDYDAMSEHNTTDNDCFYKLYETGVVKGAINETVTLTRPVAQINWGTSDIAEASIVAPDAYGAGADKLVSKVSVTNAYTTLDMFTGDVVEGKTAVVALPYLKRPDNTENVFPANTQETKYEYISAHYLLAPKSSSAVIDLKLEIANDAAATTANSEVVVTNAPYQANYRTNIYGALLTSPANITVVKEPGFADGDNNIAAPVQEVATPEEFVKAISNPGVATVKLTEDIDLSAATVEELTISGKKEISIAEGKTISMGAENYFDVVAGADLTINGGTITNAEAGLPTTPGATKGLIHATDAVLTIEGTTLVNDMDFHYHGSASAGFPYNASAISYWGQSDIHISNAKIYSGEYTLCGYGRNVNTSKIVMIDSYFESTSSNKNNGQNWAYNQRIFAAEAMMEGCTVIGIQGGVSLEGADLKMIFRDCNISTHNSDGNEDAYYAIYATNSGTAIIESGEYAAANDYGGTLSEGTSALASGDNDAGLPCGNIILKGGKFSGKAYDHTKKITFEPAEGYMYKAIEGDPVYKWKVVPVTE